MSARMLMFFFLLFGWLLFVVLGSVHVTGTKALPKTLAVLLVVLLVGTFLEGRWRWNEHRYAVTARHLTGIDGVHVYCQRLGANLIDTSTIMGYVPYNPDGTSTKNAYLRRETCTGLSSFKGSTEDAGTEQWLAVHVLTHESMHLAGLHDEAQAECAAQQRDAITARILGATEIAARRLAIGYRNNFYDHLPDQYRSQACVDGGAWDEDLPDPPWDDVRKGPGYRPPFASNAHVPSTADQVLGR